MLDDQSLALMVDMQPFKEALSAFWKEILSNENARPYHQFKRFPGGSRALRLQVYFDYRSGLAQS